MSRSSTIQSGSRCCVSSHVRASCPLRAVNTSCVSHRRTSCKKRRLSSSSSTTNTRAMRLVSVASVISTLSDGRPPSSCTRCTRSQQALPSRGCDHRRYGAQSTVIDRRAQSHLARQSQGGKRSSRVSSGPRSDSRTSPRRCRPDQWVGSLADEPRFRHRRADSYQRDEVVMASSLLWNQRAHWPGRARENRAGEQM